jgi:hypothetical protein
VYVLGYWVGNDILVQKRKCQSNQVMTENRVMKNEREKQTDIQSTESLSEGLVGGIKSNCKSTV